MVLSGTPDRDTQMAVRSELAITESSIASVDGGYLPREQWAACADTAWWLP